MILIDLLPDEYRQKRRTPVKYLAAVMASVAINGSLLAWWGWTAVGVATEVKSELELLRDQDSGLQGQVAYHKSLDAETQVFKARENMLGTVTASRVSWTEKVDQMVDLINRGGDGDKYLVWLNDLNVDTKENTRQGSFGQLKAKGNSGSPKFAQVANFLEDVEQSDLIRDFGPPEQADAKSEQGRSENLVPAEVWSFPITMHLRSPEERKANQ